MLQQNSSHTVRTQMKTQQKPVSQTPRRTFKKVFNFGMGRHEHFRGDARNPAPGLSEGGRQEILVAPGRMAAQTKRKHEGIREEHHE